MTSAGAPLAFNHVGLTVPDVFAAIDWYDAVFGFRLIMGPRLLQPAVAATHETPSVFGANFQRAYQAHLLSANGVGLELFQFVEPEVEPAEDVMHYWRRGIFHICLTDPDVAGRTEKIRAHGGKQRCPVFGFVPGRPFELVYCEDPWGTIIELMSHSYAEVFGNWPQPGMSVQPTMIERPAPKP
jgi:catechol 2,3-dioxygenase-like lactoylglutathione lyase family enzyme